jgi:hypothetical protein
MSEVQPDPTDAGTVRPKEKPLKKRGTCFDPLDYPDFDFHINLPPHAQPHDAFSIFNLFFTWPVLEYIVQNTNKNERRPKKEGQPNARALRWYELTVEELMIYLGIVIYMGLHHENRIASYWSQASNTPNHPITQYMARNRWEEIHIRLGISEPYKECNIWGRVSDIPTYFSTILTSKIL